MKHLRYDYYGAQMTGEDGHAQEVMKHLGITYSHSTPQSMGDQYWFWNCENIPENLPSYITDLEINDPMEFVGWGLSKEKAMAIKNYKSSK